MGIVRLLLALMVFNSHSLIFNFETLSGQEAVELFFVISGFFMSLVLTERHTTPAAFYRNRFLRIFPAYWVVLALSLVALFLADIHPATGWASYRETMAQNWLSALFQGGVQVLILGQEWLFGLSYFPGVGLKAAQGLAGQSWHQLPVVQSWSLSLEIAFYALAPWLVRLSTRRLLALLILCLSLRIGMNLNGFGLTELGMRAFPLELWLFLAGMLSHRATPLLLRIPRRLDLAALLLLLTVIATHGLISHNEHFQALVALTCLTMPLVFRLLRDNSIDRAASELSYPFYLVHYLVIALLEQTLEDAPPALMLSCTLGATLLLWVVAIRPFRKFTPKPTRSEPFVISPIPASIPALVPVQPDSTPQM